MRAAALVVVSCYPFDVDAEVRALADAAAGARLVLDPNPRAGVLNDRDDFVHGFETLAARAELVKVGADDAALLYDGVCMLCDAGCATAVRRRFSPRPAPTARCWTRMPAS